MRMPRLRLMNTLTVRADIDPVRHFLDPVIRRQVVGRKILASLGDACDDAVVLDVVRVVSLNVDR